MAHDQEIRVAIGVIQRGDQFLVGQRGPDGPLAGYAEFPGGKCLLAETPATAVVRECQEETGLVVQVVRLLHEGRHVYPHGVLHLSFFLCTPRTEQGPLPPFRWVPRDQLASLPFPDANGPVLAVLQKDAAMTGQG